MKIVKLLDEYDMKKYYEEKAKRKCDVCPCCGNEYDLPSSKELGIKGIIPMAVRYETKGFFKTKVYEISCYWCNECGARWESEPYEM